MTLSAVLTELTPQTTPSGLGTPVAGAPVAAGAERSAAPRREPGGVMESIGTFLRRERELRGIALDEVADTTRIPVRQLERLEDGRIAELPGEVFVKGYLSAYARAVGLKSDDVLSRYANTKRAEHVTPAPMRVSTVAAERGKRFGLAIALVVFAILATLAMSFLLRPRTQDRPEQLSQNVPAGAAALGAGAMLTG